jgi:hypothetical protein
LIAMGWFVRRFTPEWARTERGDESGIEKKRINTLKDNTERAFPNLLPDTEVVANDAGGGCGLSGMV